MKCYACSNCYHLWLHLVGDVRLVGYAKENEGIVEIMYQGIWGTICDDGWDDTDATVVCRELGFLNGTVIQPPFQFSSGPVWLKQVKCLGNESKLSQCLHKGFGNVGNCSHTQEAGVQCNGIQSTYNYVYIKSYRILLLKEQFYSNTACLNLLALILLVVRL